MTKPQGITIIGQNASVIIVIPAPFVIPILKENLDSADLLKEKAELKQTKERINAAVCSSLFGEEIYRQFYFLSDEQCARVRNSYRYADISENELMNNDKSE